MGEYEFIWRFGDITESTSHVCHGCFLGWYLTEEEAEEGCPICGFPLSVNEE